MQFSPAIRNLVYQACTLLEAVAVILFRRFQRLVRKKAKPNSTDAFLRQFLLHALGRQQPLRVTCAERTDGAGAQAHTMISAMNFAAAFGHTYVHTPFVSIDHGDAPMASWVANWEACFNLGAGELPAGAETTGLVNYSTFHPRLFHALNNLFTRSAAMTAKPQNSADPRKRLFHPFFYYSDSHPDTYLKLIPRLQEKYLRNKPATHNQVLTIAVHMRRGDIGPQNTSRFTSTETVCNTVRKVHTELDRRGEAYSIALYSQGPKGQFEPLCQMGVKMFLDEDAIWTMHQLITADVLIMSKSSFSYVAALLGSGIKIYEPFWHAPMSDWISIRSNGDFPAGKFCQALDALIERRNAALNSSEAVQ